VFSIEAVLPSGEVIETRGTPRASAGPDLRHLLLGSEGTLGVVTGVTFSVRRKPERRVTAAFHTGSMDAGFALQRELLQLGWAPPVLRQYDSTEAQRMFSAHARGDDALLLVVHEGPATRVGAEVEAVAALARSMGASPADPAATDHWLEQRNHVPKWGQFLGNGVILDTIEIAATWDRIQGIYVNAIESLRGVPGLLTASAHSSHAYRSGINLYFTFAAQPKTAAEMRSTYLDCWRRVMTATVEGGGGIAHHHGIGRVRRQWLSKEIGEAGLSALRAVKHALDPTGFMNPGALIPD
jgi:alkyldihydroxyacetonephosphate synthase